MKNLIAISIILLQFIGKITGQFYNSDPLFTVQPNAIMMVEGDFSNKVPGHFKNDGNVSIKGNVLNDEIMTGPNTGSWKLAGTSLQTISGTGLFWLKNLEINNSSGIILSNIVKVDGQIDFTNGLLGTSNIAFPLILSNIATLGNTTPVGDANHITGYVVKEGLGLFNYPVGDGTKYQPVQINLSANSLGMLVKYLPNDAVAGTFTNLGTDPTPLTGYNSNEYWSIAPYLGGTATGQVTINWDGYNDSNPTGIANRKIAHKIGLTWQNEGGNGLGNTSSGSITSNSVSVWSPFTLGFTTAAPLPLTLLDFTVKNIQNGNQLNWKTSHEINTLSFDIERSENAKLFEKIGEVSAKNNTVEGNFIYEFMDNLSLKLTHTLLFYRLKMNDLDGKYTYSKIVSIMSEPAESENLKVFPNPVSTILNIENYGENKVEIMNLFGQTKIFNTMKNYGIHASIDVTSLPSGLYIIKGKSGIAKFLKE